MAPIEAVLTITPPALAEESEAVDHRKIDALGIGGEHPIVVFLGEVGERGVGVGVAGIVDENVETAEGLLCPLHQALPVGRERDIRGDEDRLAPSPFDLLDYLAAALLVDVGDDDAASLGDESSRDGFARSRPRRR